MTQALALVTPSVGVLPNGGLFCGVGFFEGVLGREVVGLGEGWKLPLLKGELLGKGGLWVFFEELGLPLLLNSMG